MVLSSVRVAFLLALLAAPAAQATQVLALSTDQLTDRAHVVVRGKVVHTEAIRLAELPRRIHTVVTVDVQETFKHDRKAEARCTFVVPGGEIGGFGQRVPGAPSFRVGDEVVLFLSRTGPGGRLQLVGLPVGRYIVERPPGGLPPRAVSRRAGVTLVRRGPDGRLAPVPNAAVDDLPLSVLLERVRARLAPRP